MQEIQYINLKGEVLRFGGKPPLVLESVGGTEGAEVSRKSLKASTRDGERTVAMQRECRRLDIAFHIFTYGRSELYRERANLSSILSPEKGFDPATGERARVIYKNDFGQWWTWAVPARTPQWGKRLRDIHPSIKISLDCDSAYWFSMEESRGGFSASEGGFSFPFAFPLRFYSREWEATLLNKGHAPAPVRITVHGEGERPTLVNRTTGAKIGLTAPLPTNVILHISTDPEDLYVLMEENGAVRNAYGYLDVTTPISDFYLAPGLNQIVYEAGEAANRTWVELTWRSRFEGV